MIYCEKNNNDHKNIMFVSLYNIMYMILCVYINFKHPGKSILSVVSHVQLSDFAVFSFKWPGKIS